MNIVTVLPIKKAIHIDSLTYFSTNTPEIGSIVEIPIRKKMVPAIVSEVSDVRTNRMALKNSEFALRKMEHIISKPFLPKFFMSAVDEASEYFATSKGATIFLLLHKHTIEQGILEIDNSKDVVVYIYPTAHSAKLKYKENKENTVLFVGDMSAKAYKSNFDKINNGANIIIMTGAFLALIPANAKKIIIEDSYSRWYKGRIRPFLDIRTIVEIIGRNLKTKVEHRDILLNKDIPANKITIVSNKKKEGEKFSIFSKETEEKITKTLDEKQKIFVFALRKGHSPIVLCCHCSKVVLCNNCESPVVLYKKSPANYFLCHHCGTKRDALEKCSACGSWKLESLGIGIEKIEEEINKKWPNKKEFIEVGTEKSLDDLTSYSLSIIPSIDSLLSIPDFGIDDAIFRYFLNINKHTNGEVVVGTKYAELPLLKHIQNLDTDVFNKNQLEKKQKFGYPPFKVFIKITFRGDKDKIQKEITKTKEILSSYNPAVFPAFIKNIQNKFIFHMLIKVPSDKWPDATLLELLRSLPPSIEINVNPESLI